jgi:hypothetical protein
MTTCAVHEISAKRAADAERPKKQMKIEPHHDTA